MTSRLRALLSVLLVLVIAIPPTLAEDDPQARGGTAEARDAPEPEPGHTPEDDPCAPAWQRLEARLQEIAERYEAAHAEKDREADAFYAGNHSQEEREAYEKRQQEERDRLYAEEEAERDAAHMDFDRECQEAMKASGYDRPHPGDHPEPARPYPHGDDGYHHDDQPPEWVSEECRALMHEFEAEQRKKMEQVHTELQAKWDAFEERMRQRWDDFYRDGNRTEEESAAFEREMEAEREAFREEMFRYEEEARADEEAFFEQYHEKIEAACRMDDRPMPAHPGGEVPAEIEALHQKCEEKMQRLETAFRSEMEALERAWRDAEDGDRTAFEEKIRAKEAAFEAELRETMRACEEEARALWEAQMPMHEADAAFDRMGSWSLSESGGKVLLTGKYVSLVGDPSTNTMGRIAVEGETFIQRLDTLGALEFFDMEEATDGDSTLVASGEGIRLRLHDNPGGVINLHADEARAFLLTIPPSIEVASSANGWTLTGADGSAFLRAAPGHAEWAAGERTLKVWGESTFMVKDKAGNEVLPSVANKHRPDLVRAVEDRRLGAEVTIAKDAAGDAVDESVVYDGEVEVGVATAKTADESPVTITVSSHTLKEGRTFVVNVDESVLAGKVKVAYFDVDEESGEETPAKIQKASSLRDILDAADDETAEYWVVEDELGKQVLVSVPKWSVHRFRLESAGPEAGMELALPGPVFLLVALSAIAVAAARTRRD